MNPVLNKARQAWRHHPDWPVWAVAVIALVSALVLFKGETRDLDPQVWQAIVAGADIPTPDLSYSYGETR